MPQVSVLVVNYCAGAWLARSLAGLAAQSLIDFEAIIVDNASTDYSVERAEVIVRGDPRFQFKRLERNIGFAAANNLAAGCAVAELLAVLNPDAIPAIDWLEHLVDAANNYPEVAMFGSTQINAINPSLLDGCGDQYLFAGLPWRGGFGWPLAALPAGNRTVFSPCGAAALYRRKTFIRVGGFDETFFCYVEDIDLAFRMRLLGHNCMQIGEATVWHVGDACTKPTSCFAEYYGIRNLVWCFAKNMPWPLLVVILPVHAAVLAILWFRSLSRGQGWVIARAIIAALRGLPLQTRRRVQASRTVHWWTIAEALSWSPRCYLVRAPARTPST